MRTTPWTHEDATRPTEPAPADEHDAAERWVDQFLTQMRDADHVLAIALADDFATLGDV